MSYQIEFARPNFLSPKMCQAFNTMRTINQFDFS